MTCSSGRGRGARIGQKETGGMSQVPGDPAVTRRGEVVLWDRKWYGSPRIIMNRLVILTLISQ
jgi:hypothetical protein